MEIQATITPREALRKAIHDIRNESIAKFIKTLRDGQLNELAEQLLSANGAPDLIRELLRLWVMQPPNENDKGVAEAREYLGWKVDSQDFNSLRPEFLDVVYLLPPRDYAITQTLLPLLEHERKNSSAQLRDPGIQKLLDVGTGTGLLIQVLKRANLNGEMMGVDPASTLAFYASRRFGKPSDVKIKVQTIQEFDKTSEFQMALCYMVLHHVVDAGEYQRALTSIFRALSEGGIFLYTDKLCAGFYDNGDPKSFDFTTATKPLRLKSGQEFEMQSAELNSVRPFQPHPGTISEHHRKWDDAAEVLSKTGFLIQCAKPLNERVMLFICRKPHVKIWNSFAQEPEPKFQAALTKGGQFTIEEGHSPYHWTYDILGALYEDIARRSPEPFLRGIAYFSWEKASRLFLVRRAVPFDFHILSYSHVHDGWGSLGRMVEDFESETAGYVDKKGYSCLTRDAVQRTLPFQGDIDTLNYEAAMAIPIYKGSAVNGYELRGAFLLYLAKPEYVPLYTGSGWQDPLVDKFKALNTLMNTALDRQEKLLKISDSSRKICAKWERLAKERDNVVIGRLEIEVEMNRLKSRAEISLGLANLCSNIQALLSGSECFSVLDDRLIDNGKTAILVAARYGISYEEIKKKMLTAIGSAADAYGPFVYKCTQLGKEEVPASTATKTT